MDLIESARHWVLQNLPYDSSDAQLSAHLNQLDAHGLLVVFHNWNSRLIRQAPRKIHRSSTFEASLSTSRHAEAVSRIINDIEIGNNLTKYLSRRIIIPAQVPQQVGKFTKRRDLDPLLTCWNIHHLHLGAAIECNGFVSRTDDLLFAVFREHDAYLIDIVGHGGFYEGNLLRVLMNELPGSNVVQELDNVAGRAYEPDELDIKKFRNAGVNIAHTIDGKVVIPFGGMTLAGTSFFATRDADMLLAQLEAFQLEWQKDPDKIRTQFAKNGVTLPPTPTFEFRISELGPSVVELATNSFCRIKVL